MARKWSETIEEEVTGLRLNKTGKGFDNITSVTRNADGSLDQVVADGYTYEFFWTTELLTKIEEWDTGVLKQDWEMTYDSEGDYTGVTNNIY